ncbi:MAG TPA: enolase C-terminal domain-like protein [Tepidisphaeraceae bacterium]|jgi:L-alanine-DL-glutamate epimerase-like enolase superfamily enzyme|nr:enolase C-terminal domain-like protein [Tepidisphaeraceae bacterium]
MLKSRRSFLKTAGAGAVAGTVIGCAADGRQGEKGSRRAVTQEELGRVLDAPVLNTKFLREPVIVESVELLRNGKTFLLRTRSKAGVEAISVPNSSRMEMLYPLFVSSIMPFFVGKDARELEKHLWEVFRYRDNYKYQGLALWCGVAAMEMALLELMAQTAKRPMADFFGGAIKRDIPIYTASGVRGNTPEAEIEHLQKLVAESGAKALKYRLGGRMNRNVDSLPGRSEALIPLVRKTFGDGMTLYADSNSSYDVKNSIRIGKMMEEHGYGFFEEPVEFDRIWECKEVADALTIPIALGEQEFSERRFAWCIGNRACDIVQPDLHYYGGLIRSSRVARMAAAAGMAVVPHMSGGSLGYLEVVHFASWTPNIGPFQEFKGNADIPVECETSSLKAEKGMVRCPSGVGFGVKVDPEFLGKARRVEI